MRFRVAMAERAFDYSVAADHPCLAGHFPGNPVVPAVMLMEFVGAALNEALGRRVRLAGVPLAKFMAPLLPRQALRVELNVDEGANSARFRLLREGVELASGRVEYAGEGGDE